MTINTLMRVNIHFVSVAYIRSNFFIYDNLFLHAQHNRSQCVDKYFSNKNYVEHTKLSNVTISNRLTLHEAAIRVNLFVIVKSSKMMVVRGSGHVLNISQISIASNNYLKLT